MGSLPILIELNRLKSAIQQIPSNLQIQSHKANGSILDMKAEKYGLELIMKINLSRPPHLF